MKKGTNDGTCLKAVGLELGTKRRSQPPWVVPHSRTFFLFFSCPALVISVIDDFLHSIRTSHLRLNMSISTSRVSSTQQKFRTIRRDPSHPATLHFSTFLDQYQTARIPSLPGSTCATWPFRYAVRGGQGRIGLQKSKHRILFSFFLHSHLTLLHFYSSSFSLSASFDFSHSFTHTHTVFTLLPSPHLISSFTRLHPLHSNQDDLQRPLPFPPRRCRHGQPSSFFRTTQLSISRQQGDSPFDP